MLLIVLVVGSSVNGVALDILVRCIQPAGVHRCRCSATRQLSVRKADEVRNNLRGFLNRWA
ncbi:hypothetical protein MJ561_05265 [Klebsiella pneumoniae]|nr:hypothetical protein MJ561_05265 [Klebsiella pneumoniae]